MNYKSFWILLMSISIAANDNETAPETLHNATAFYKAVFSQKLLNPFEKEFSLESRKRALLARTPGYNNHQEEKLDAFALIAAADIENVLNCRIELLQKAAQEVRHLLEKNYAIDNKRLYWSNTLLKDAFEKVVIENPNLFESLNDYQNQRLSRQIVQQLTEEVVAEFACAYGKEDGCKGMGWRRFLFGKKAAYYLRLMQERDPFEKTK